MIRNLLGTMLRLLRMAIALTVWPWRNEIHVTRFSMYRELRDVIGKVCAGAPLQNVLTIGDSAPFVRHMGLDATNTVEANYPTYDMMDLHQFEDGSFDFVVSDQVLEHVDGSPFAALAESFRVAKPGAIVVHTTCFVNPVHYGPKDLWRFTPYALRSSVSPHGEVLASGGWGNPLAVGMVALGLRHTPTPPSWHPIGRIARWNSNAWPILTWVVARKHDEQA